MSKYKNIQYLETKEENKTVEVNGYLLHSKYKPVKEATDHFKKSFKAGQVYVLFGIGLGYIVEVLESNQVKKENIIIIDPLFQELRSMMQIDISNIDVLSEVSSLKIENVLSSKIKNYERNIQVICSPNYDKLFPHEYKSVLENVRNFQKNNQVLENTTYNFSEIWQKNYIYNLMELDKSTSFENLKGKYTVPIIVASGGPSLSKNLPIVREYRNKMILVASGSTINTLLAAGIPPDYVVSVDGGEANYVHFKNINQKEIKLIYNLSSNYKIQEDWKNEKYAILDSGDLEVQKYIKKVFDITIPCIPGGASVANFAFSCALNMTTGPVALIGQDLAYTNNETHAHNNKHYKKIDEEYMQERGMFEVEGFYGDKVLTDGAFFLMKQGFERLYTYLSDGRVIYNCTEGGARIKNMPQQSFKTFCEKYMLEEKSIYLTEEKNIIDRKKVCKSLEKELKLFDNVEKNLKKIEKLIKENTTTFLNRPAIVAKLNSVDQDIIKLKQSSMINYILDPIILNIMTKFKEKDNETWEEKNNRIYKQNKFLYANLLIVIVEVKGYLQKVLEEFENE